jgi:hypothetical protein
LKWDSKKEEDEWVVILRWSRRLKKGHEKSKEKVKFKPTAAAPRTPEAQKRPRPAKPAPAALAAGKTKSAMDCGRAGNRTRLGAKATTKPIESGLPGHGERVTVWEK